MQQVDQIFELFEGRGCRSYGGEHVSQLEHALQTAHRAEESGAPGTGSSSLPCSTTWGTCSMTRLDLGRPWSRA